MHNADKIVMGAIRSNFREVSNIKGTVEAGLAVFGKSDGTGTLLKSDGVILGISVGKDLSDTNRIAYCRKGTEVPIQVTTSFTPTIGAQVQISDTTGKAVTSGGTNYNAIYRKYVAGGGIKEDGTACDVAIIDFPGGL